MEKFKSILKKDMSCRAFWVLAACIFAAKAVLAHYQMLYVWVGGAPIDDELMFKAARSIAAGEWLGAYNSLTLSKQMFFAVWLALCSRLGVPYLVAGQLLMCAAALASSFALAPVLRRWKSRFLVFAALALSPAAAASFTLRVYRDNIFPAECLLLFAGIIGCALRWRRPVSHWWGWLCLAGVGMGLAKITREDGIWLAPFALVGAAIIAVCVLREKSIEQKLLRCAALLVPFALTAVCVLAMSAMNLAHYGVFTTSDFSEGSFAAAYGAMTRVAHAEGDDDTVPVPYSVRVQLYELIPALDELRPWLEENPNIQNGYMNKTLGEYAAGSFYWVLRRAAQEEGIYDDAVTAAAYWQAVADAVNAAIDAGTLQADCGPRKSTTPIIRAKFVLPTLKETFYSFYYCATFRDCLCYYSEELSLATAEGAAEYTEFLGSGVNYAAVENESYPHYSARQKLVYMAFDALIPLYAVLVPVLLVWAAMRQIRTFAALLRARADADEWMLWLVLLGVLGMALLRCAMIAFVEVAAFNIGTYVMYLASVHPLLIMYGTAGVLSGRGRVPYNM